MDGGLMVGGFQNIWDQNWDKKRYRTDLGPGAKIQDQIRDKKVIGLIWELEQSYRTKFETKKVIGLIWELEQSYRTKFALWPYYNEQLRLKI